MTDLTKLTAPLGLLDEVYGPGTADALMAHGGPYQYFSASGSWVKCFDPSWHSSSTYRVAPATQDTVPWHFAPKEAKWYSRDRSGRCYVYDKTPREGNGFWIAMNVFWRIDGFQGHAIGTVDWKDSLQARPSDD